ncbi:MAG: putative effector of murein hydrolase LrgA [Herbinix sp.]|jgi:holin-like protein|nr:putative effector of murein hydrolase LrgA [Herbinix sp.]
MLYIKQIAVILTITLISEGIKFFIPLPIPASIYGMLLLFILLNARIIKLEQVKKTGYFLIDIMPLMFIPAAVGLMDAWISMKGRIIPLVIITTITTLIVMLVSGWTTQFMIRRKG